MGYNHFVLKCSECNWGWGSSTAFP